LLSTFCGSRRPLWTWKNRVSFRGVLFGSPIYRAKDGTYTTCAIGYFVLSTYAVPPYVTIMSLAVALAFGGRSLSAGMV